MKTLRERTEELEKTGAETWAHPFKIPLVAAFNFTVRRSLCDAMIARGKKAGEEEKNKKEETQH